MSDTSILDRSWPEKATARRWLQRNPQEGLTVQFDQSRGVFCLRPEGHTTEPIVAAEEETPPTEAQEPVAAVISEPVKIADPTKHGNRLKNPVDMRT